MAAVHQEILYKRGRALSQAGTGTRALLLALLFGTTAFGVGYVVLNQSTGKVSGEPAAALYILGPARALISEGLYARADLYFHKGSPPAKSEAFHSFYQKWKNAICPTVHAHAKGREVEEILPWLRMASQSDPQNIEIYLVATYWLNGECGRPDLAEQALMEAIETNPTRYELYLEMSRMQLGQDSYEAALASLRTAHDLITQPNQLDPEQVAIDLPFILMSQSYVNEALGRRSGAMATTEEVLALGSNEHFSKRLRRLRQGNVDPEGAKDRLRRLFHKTHSCDREEHEHGCGCDGCSPNNEATEHVHGPDCGH